MNGNVGHFGSRVGKLDERGATLVEHAVALPVFFLLVFATMELLLFSYRVLTVQFLATRILRQAVVGPEEMLGELPNRSELLIARLIREASVFSVTLKPEDIELCAASSRDDVLLNCVAPDASGRFVLEDGAAHDAAGEPGQLLALRTTFKAQIARIGAINITNTVIGRNESWNR